MSNLKRVLGFTFASLASQIQKRKVKRQSKISKKIRNGILNGEGL